MIRGMSYEYSITICPSKPSSYFVMYDAYLPFFCANLFSGHTIRHFCWCGKGRKRGYSSRTALILLYIWHCPPDTRKFEHATTRFPTLWNYCEWAGKKHFVSLKLEGQSGIRSFFQDSSWYSIFASILLIILLVELYSVVFYQLQHINHQPMMIHYLFDNNVWSTTSILYNFELRNVVLTTFGHQPAIHTLFSPVFDMIKLRHLYVIRRELAVAQWTVLAYARPASSTSRQYTP